MRKPSTHICLRCGLPVTRWLDGWKHAANGHTKSCGNPPLVAPRAKYEAEMAAIAATAKIDAKRL